MRLTLVSLVIIFGIIGLSFDLPLNWFKAGSSPESYDMGVDKGAGPNGKNAATIKSIKKKITGFGTLMQESLPDKYLGKKIKMTGYLKAKNVKGWAGFWLRVDQAQNHEPLSFDNMGDRPVTGTADWKKYEIILDVPQNASNLACGALLSGTGQIWFADISFETVDATIKNTGKSAKEKLKEPANLDFQE